MHKDSSSPEIWIYFVFLPDLYSLSETYTVAQCTLPAQHLTADQQG